MQVLSTARPVSAFLFAFSLLFIAAVVLVSGRGWEHSLLGSLFPYVFSVLVVSGMVLNWPVWRLRYQYVVLDGSNLKVAGAKPLRLDEITDLQIGRGALQQPTLRIFSKDRKIPISSLMASTPLAELKAAIEGARATPRHVSYLRTDH